MRLLLTTCVLLLVVSMFSCESKLSESDLAVLHENSFDIALFQNVKSSSTGDFIQYELSDPGYIVSGEGEMKATGNKKHQGISFGVDPEEADSVVMRNRKSFHDAGYIIFTSEIGFDTTSTISVIKSADQFDVLRLQGTDGINYDVTNEDVIAKLKEWEARYGLDILGADYDWADIMLRNTPEDVSAFSKEVYAFCPDIIEQGFGDIEELEKHLKENPRLFLWWD